VDDGAEGIEVLDHPPGRALGLQRAAQGNLQPVRVAVRPRTLAQVVRENVRRLEPEKLTYLHVSQSSR
jgi:hypothetical protein